MTKQIHIRLDDMVYSAAVSFAESSGKTLQDIVNDAVKLLIANRAQAQNRNNKEFTFIDLFAGIGGMRIAFERQGAIAYIQMNGINTVSRHILPILASNLMMILQKSMHALFHLMIFLSPVFRVSRSA